MFALFIMQNNIHLPNIKQMQALLHKLLSSMFNANSVRAETFILKSLSNQTYSLLERENLINLLTNQQLPKHLNNRAYFKHSPSWHLKRA